MRCSWLVIVTILFSTACYFATAQTKIKSDEVYLWRYQFVKGDLTRVKTHIGIECRMFDRTSAADIDQTAIDKTESVNVHGDAGIIETTNAVKSTSNGVGIADEAKNRDPMLITFSTDGLVVLSARAAGHDAFHIGPIWQMMLERPAPEAAVRVGDTWKTDVSNRLVQGEKTPVISTLVGPEKLLGVITLKVQVHMSIPPDAASEDKDDVIMDGFYNVDPLAGRLTHSEYTISNFAVTGPDGAAVMRISVKQDFERMTQVSSSKSGN